MSERDLTITLRDIVDYCDRIITSLEKVNPQQFEMDLMLQDATMRRFEIIGEAIKQIPEEIKNRYPDIPWKKAAGFRDVLIHNYPEIVLGEVYKTGVQQLPSFRDQIQKVHDELNAD